MIQQVFMNDDDISEFVSAIPALVQQTGEIGQVIINDIPSITGQNRTGFWDAQSICSPFFGTDPAKFEIRILQDGIQTYRGKIKNVKSDGVSRTAEVTLRSSIQEMLERGCIYVSPDGGETPADAVRNIASLYKIPINTASFGISAAIYNTDNALVQVVAIDPDASVLEIIQQIADIGVAKVYAMNGFLFYDVFRERTSVPLVQFSDNPTNPDGTTLFSHPVTEISEREKVFGYSIQTMQGPVTFGTDDQQGRSISAGADSPVRIPTLQAGVIFGDLSLEYLNKVQRRITFQVPKRIGRELPIDAAVSVEYTSRDWTITTLDIIALDNSNKVFSVITGLTR